MEREKLYWQEKDKLLNRAFSMVSVSPKKLNANDDTTDFQRKTNYSLGNGHDSKCSRDTERWRPLF